MGKTLYSSRLITKNDVYSVAVIDITPPDLDGRKFRILVTDSGGAAVPSESRDVAISSTWLATQPYDELDLHHLLVQFRETLPTTIRSQHRDVFEYPIWSRDAKLYQVGKLLETYFKSGDYSLLEQDWIRNSITIHGNEIHPLLVYFEQNNVIRHPIPGRKEDWEKWTAAKNWSINLKQLFDQLRPVDWEDARGLTIAPTPATIHRETVLADAVISPEPTCTQPRFDGSVCGRPVVADNMCICHLDNDDKGLDDFTAAISKVIKAVSEHDFTGFVFPPEYQFPLPIRFLKRVIFRRCRFRCFVGLRKCEFEKQVVIDECHFYAGASFERARFLGAVEIRQSILRNINLSYSVFWHSFVFVQNSLSEGRTQEHGSGITDAIVDIHGSQFEEGSRVFIRGIRARDISLRGCNLFNVAQIHFDDLNRNDNYTFLLADEINIQRMKKAGEIVGREYYQALADSYQQLQRHMISLRNYTDAGGFHRREMEIRRKHLSETVADRFLLPTYRLVAGYGESIWKPALWFIGMLLIVPVVTVFWMGDTNLEYTGNLSDLDDGLAAWWNDLVSNLEALFFAKDDPLGRVHLLREKTIAPGWRLLIMIERVLTAILLSFLVIGVRRRFRRY
jgi:hypothetical protein